MEISLTPKQLQILKEALDFHLTGFSPEDAPTDWDEASKLNEFITFKLNESNIRQEAALREIRNKLGM
jgi:hypothetical protein